MKHGTRSSSGIWSEVNGVACAFTDGGTEMIGSENGCDRGKKHPKGEGSVRPSGWTVT